MLAPILATMTIGAIRTCLCLALLAAGLAAAEPAQAELDALAARHQRSRTLRGEFTWLVQPIVGEADPARRPRSGSFAYAAPASYNIVVREGDGGPVDRWCSDGSARWEVSRLSPDDPADIKGPLPVDGGDADHRRLVACLRLDVGELRKDHLFAWRPGAERVLELRPRQDGDQRRGPQVVVIAIALSADGDPRRVDIDHTDGNRWTVEVARLERDVDLPPGMFSPR
jgi:hypothetical protein